MPPSPVVRSLRGWKEKAARSAPAPTGRPRYTDPDGAGGIFDDRDPARIAQRPHTSEVGGYTRLVNEDDSTGAIGQVRLHRRRSQVLRDLLDVGEYGHCSDVARRVRGRDEGQRWDDDLVTRPDPGYDKR